MISYNGEGWVSASVDGELHPDMRVLDWQYLNDCFEPTVLKGHMVNVNRVRRVKEFLNSINKANLEDLMFVENEEMVKVPAKHIEDFKFLGLNNVDFITRDWYRTGVSEDE